MPPVLALLLLALGLGARGGRGCLQCAPSVQEALRDLRSAIVPWRFHQEHMRARARALLLGMEGPFFRNYALNVFVGKVEVDDLEAVVDFFKNETSKLEGKNMTDEPLLEELVALRENAIMKLKKGLKSYKQKACDRKTCRSLKEEVWDCLHCQKTMPRCVRKKYCFGDRQFRMVLQYRKEGGILQNPGMLGVIAVVCLAAVFFGVIVVSAIIYRENRKILLQSGAL